MSDFRDLFIIACIVVASAAFATLPVLNETPMRAVLGFALIFFAPGYAFVSALFPRKGELEGVERLALSMGLSICIVVFIGLGLNYTPWGIRLGPILMSISAFTLIFVALSAYRRARCVDVASSRPQPST